jgi:hypothetical protein
MGDIHRCASWIAAIAVRPGETEFAWIQFEGLDRADNADSWWKPGVYDFEISLWVNAKTQKSHPHTTARFRASVPEEFQQRLDEYRKTAKDPFYWALGVIWWFPLEKCLPQMLKRAQLK